MFNETTRDLLQTVESVAERQLSAAVSGVTETPLVQAESALTLSVPFTHRFLLLHAGISFSFAGYF